MFFTDPVSIFNERWNIFMHNSSHFSGTQRETDDSIQAAALSAIMNITNGSDSNRTLTVELNGLRPILEAISSSQNSESVCSGVMALSNITFNDSFSADKVVNMGGHVSALVALQTCDVSCDHQLISACLVLLANLCCNESSQSILGATECLCEVVLKTCSTTRCVSQDPRDVY